MEVVKKLANFFQVFPCVSGESLKTDYGLFQCPFEKITLYLSLGLLGAYFVLRKRTYM